LYAGRKSESKPAARKGVKRTSWETASGDVPPLPTATRGSPPARLPTLPPTPFPFLGHSMGPEKVYQGSGSRRRPSRDHGRLSEQVGRHPCQSPKRTPVWSPTNVQQNTIHPPGACFTVDTEKAGRLLPELGHWGPQRRMTAETAFQSSRGGTKRLYFECWEEVGPHSEREGGPRERETPPTSTFSSAT
jgi:hypothetical protein